MRIKNKKIPVAVLVNDIHLTKDNGDLVKSVMSQVVDYANGNGIQDIVIGGDVFTNRSGQPLQCLLDFKNILDRILCGMNVHIIPGNHDKTDPNSDASYLDVYDVFDGVTVYRKATVCEIGGCCFCFVPYYGCDRWIDEYKRCVSGVDFDSVCFLVTHIAINGVRNNDGSLVSDEIDCDLFNGFDSVLVGHYHNSSTIGENIYYTGSAYQANYGEDLDKGFAVLFDDGSVKRINTDFPHYVKHVIDASDRKTLSNLVEKYGVVGEDLHVRFEFVGKRTDFENIDFRNIETKYGIECRFVSDEDKEIMSVCETEDLIQYNKSDLRKDFVHFCSESKIKGAELRFGLELFKKLI